MRPSRRVHGAVLVVLAAVGLAVYGRVFTLKPFGEDNFYILQWVDRAPAAALLRLNPAIYPEWRPLAYVTIWLQYRLDGLTRIQDYYAVNLALWVTAAWLVYRVALHVAPSAWAAAAGGMFVLTDARALQTQTLIVDRQTPMACIFGLLAVWLFLRTRDRRLAGGAGWLLAGLLLASALSKEYGLAFAGGLAIYAALERRLDVVAAAVAGALAYVTLRLCIVHGGFGVYCEDMGFFFDRRTVCYDGIDAHGLGQMAYNAAASAVGTLVPGLFTDWGQIAPTRRVLPLSLAWLAVIAIGFRGGSRPVRLAAWIAAGVAALGFMSYAGRNQVVAVCALGLAVAAGLAAAADRLSGSPRWVRAAGAAAIVAALALQAGRTRTLTIEEVDQLAHQDPCAELVEHPEAASFARRVQALYAPAAAPCARH